MVKLRALRNKTVLFILLGFLVLFFGLLAILSYKTFAIKGEKYEPEAIVVDFSDETSYEEAVKIVESLGLNFPIERSISEDFQANTYIYIDSEKKFDELAKILREKPEVLVVEPANLHTQSKEKMLIEFVSGVTRSQAKTILNEVGLKLENFYRRDAIVIKVPIGKEKYYVDQFNKLSGVEEAYFNYYFTNIYPPGLMRER